MASSALNVVLTGLRSIDACHLRRDRHRVNRDCNFLFDVAAFTQATARAIGRVNAECRTEDPVRSNFPNGDLTTALSFLEIPTEDSGSEVQGAPSFEGARTAVAQLRRCHAAIGRSRTDIVSEVARAELRCQLALDRQGGHLESISPSCILGPTRSASRARQRITAACGGISGAEVGSCHNLPECVIQAATRTAQAAARDAFGGTPAERKLLCGNGVRDIGEECDDGPANGPGPCNGNCQKAFCGDGFVEAGVEECDDANSDNTDSCLTTCKLARCGDGFIEKGVEDCDPAAPNTPPGSCPADCKNEVICGSDGALSGLVILTFSATQFSDVAGITVDLSYPASVMELSVHDETSGSGINQFFDTKSQHRLRFAHASTSADTTPGKFRLVDFICNPGDTIRASDFACVVVNSSDPQGIELGMPTQPNSVCIVSLMVSSAPSTTSTTTSTTSTTVVTTTSTSTTSTALVTTTSTTTSTSSTASVAMGSPHYRAPGS